MGSVPPRIPWIWRSTAAGELVLVERGGLNDDLEGVVLRLASDSLPSDEAMRLIAAAPRLRAAYRSRILGVAGACWLSGALFGALLAAMVFRG